MNEMKVTRQICKKYRSKFVVNSVNLFRISIASSTSFRNGGDMGLSGT